MPAPRLAFELYISEANLEDLIEYFRIEYGVSLDLVGKRTLYESQVVTIPMVLVPDLESWCEMYNVIHVKKGKIVTL